jgi:hypothetical protein
MSSNSRRRYEAVQGEIERRRDSRRCEGAQAPWRSTAQMCRELKADFSGRT